MDDQQNRRAESGLHAGTEREAGSDCVRGNVAGMQGRRKRHLTAQIKPATRNAILDQLAAIADGIIGERERAERQRELHAADKALASGLIHKAWQETSELRKRRWWHYIGGLR